MRPSIVRDLASGDKILLREKKKGKKRQPCPLNAVSDAAKSTERYRQVIKRWGGR